MHCAWINMILGCVKTWVVAEIAIGNVLELCFPTEPKRRSFLLNLKAKSFLLNLKARSFLLNPKPKAHLKYANLTKSHALKVSHSL